MATQRTLFGYTYPQLRKFFVSVLGFVLTVLAVLLEGDLIPESWTPWILGFIGVCTSYGVFRVRNTANATHLDPAHPQL